MPVEIQTHVRRMAKCKCYKPIQPPPPPSKKEAEATGMVTEEQTSPSSPMARSPSPSSHSPAGPSPTEQVSVISNPINPTSRINPGNPVSLISTISLLH